MTFIIHCQILLSCVLLALQREFSACRASLPLSLSPSVSNIIQTGSQYDNVSISFRMFVSFVRTYIHQLSVSRSISLSLSSFVRIYTESLTSCTDKCLAGLPSSMSSWAEVEQGWRASVRYAGGRAETLSGQQRAAVGRCWRARVERSGASLPQPQPQHQPRRSQERSH